MTGDRSTAAELERIARLYLSHGQPIAAAQLLAAAAELDPSSPSILRMRTLAAFRTGDFSAAMAFSRKAMPGADISGRSALAVLEAVSLMRLGRADEARQRFLARADETEPNAEPVAARRSIEIEEPEAR